MSSNTSRLIPFYNRCNAPDCSNESVGYEEARLVRWYNILLIFRVRQQIVFIIASFRGMHEVNEMLS